jgi:hypothetical protein
MFSAFVPEMVRGWCPRHFRRGPAATEALSELRGAGRGGKPCFAEPSSYAWPSSSAEPTEDKTEDETEDWERG